jgi:coproporphyrinogen III oxidase
MDTRAVRDQLLALQARIVSAMEAEDGSAFIADPWVREPGGKLEGDGLSRLIEGGATSGPAKPVPRWHW